LGELWSVFFCAIPIPDLFIEQSMYRKQKERLISVLIHFIMDFLKICNEKLHTLIKINENQDQLLSNEACNGFKKVITVTCSINIMVYP
jgi:hypothetical protein